MGANYCDLSVCLFVCPSVRLSAVFSSSHYGDNGPNSSRTSFVSSPDSGNGAKWLSTSAGLSG